MGRMRFNPGCRYDTCDNLAAGTTGWTRTGDHTAVITVDNIADLGTIIDGVTTIVITWVVDGVVYHATATITAHDDSSITISIAGTLPANSVALGTPSVKIDCKGWENPHCVQIWKTPDPITADQREFNPHLVMPCFYRLHVTQWSGATVPSRNVGDYWVPWWYHDDATMPQWVREHCGEPTTTIELVKIGGGYGTRDPPNQVGACPAAWGACAGTGCFYEEGEGGAFGEQVTAVWCMRLTIRFPWGLDIILYSARYTAASTADLANAGCFSGTSWSLEGQWWPSLLGDSSIAGDIGAFYALHEGVVINFSYWLSNDPDPYLGSDDLGLYGYGHRYSPSPDPHPDECGPCYQAVATPVFPGPPLNLGSCCERKTCASQFVGTHIVSPNDLPGDYADLVAAYVAFNSAVATEEAAKAAYDADPNPTTLDDWNDAIGAREAAWAAVVAAETQVNSDAPGPCCLKVEFSGVRPEGAYSAGVYSDEKPIAYYGYQVDLPGAGETPDWLNPTTYHKRFLCIPYTAPSEGVEEVPAQDSWKSQPATALNPFPVMVLIEGVPDEIIDGSGPGYVLPGLNITMYVYGGENVAIEDSGGLVLQFVGFAKNLGFFPFDHSEKNGTTCWNNGPTYPWVQVAGEWPGPVFDFTNFQDQQLDYVTHDDVSFPGWVRSTDPELLHYRGPDYTSAHVNVSLASKGFYDCVNPTDTSLFEKVWGWKVEWTDGRGYSESIVATKTDVGGYRWTHSIFPWTIWVDTTFRDGAALLRLLYSGTKWSLNYGFGFPAPSESQFDPCYSVSGGWGVANKLYITDIIPAEPIDRYAFLDDCNIMPGSTLTLTPRCTPLDPLPIPSKCDTTTWDVYTLDYGLATLTGSAGGPWSVTVHDVLYTITRGDDGASGEANYTLSMKIGDDDADTVDFSTDEEIDCCERGTIHVTVGGLLADVTAICPTDCDVPSFTVVVGGTATYIVPAFTQYWHHQVGGTAIPHWQLASDPPPDLLVDVVKLTGYRYTICISHWDILGQIYHNYTATVSYAGNCDDAGTMSGTLSGSADAWDGGKTVTLTPG